MSTSNYPDHSNQRREYSSYSNLRLVLLLRFPYFIIYPPLSWLLSPIFLCNKQQKHFAFQRLPLTLISLDRRRIGGATSDVYATAIHLRRRQEVDG